MKTQHKTILLSWAKAVYHRLPLSQAAKWRLRARLQPVLMHITSSQAKSISLKSIVAVLRASKHDAISGQDYGIEQRLQPFCKIWLLMPRTMAPLVFGSLCLF